MSNINKVHVDEDNNSIWNRKKIIGELIIILIGMAPHIINQENCKIRIKIQYCKTLKKLDDEK